MLLTMPDMTWTVRVDRWTWIYAFSRLGTVRWRDPGNGMHGNGTWRVENGSLITRWFPSKTWEEWDLPIFPQKATGKAHMADGTFDLEAEAQDYYLRPGDVVYDVGQAIVRSNGTVASVIYPDEVRTGGTVAWICRNPGNIRDGDKYGAYKGKQLQVKKVGGFAIFPDEDTGLQAVVSILKVYGHVTLKQAMYKYAPPSDHNDPDKYAATLADGLGVPDSTFLTTLTGEQMKNLAKLITGVEHTQKGTPWGRDDSALPPQISQRLPPHLYPLTDDDLRNTSIGAPW